MDLEFEKYCKVDQSPRTVLPSSHHHSKLEKRIKNPKPSSKNNQLSLEAGFKEIKLRNYHRSVSCRTLPARNKELLVDNRGSVYQCSKERTLSSRYDSVNRTKKIEISVGTPYSFSLLDSICGSDEEEEEAIEDEDNNQFLLKSLSAKIALPDSPTNSRLESWFTPNRSIIDHFTKQNSFGTRNKALQKSLMHDFSCAMKKDQVEIVEPSSPAHLHGDLRIQYKHGVPYFELSIPNSDNALVVKTWKAENELNWVYTFHSISSRKKSKDSSIVAQMQVSSHLCSEMRKNGTFSDSMITEFVLYDITHTRKSLDSQELNSEREVELQPSNEIVSIVIKAPFEKRESLKNRSSDLLDLSLAGQTQDFGETTVVNVIAPLGIHSLPTCESKGPLSLLDRWRKGGGCDCGGWDMACPLHIFDNSTSSDSLLHNNQPFKLHLQGTKEKTPALTMKLSRKGHYTIHFHAQLSTLQVLAVCVSVLHASEVSSEVDQEKHKQLIQSRSKKGVIEDQVKILIEAVAQEEKKRNTVRRKVVKVTEENSHSFVLNPPFSPIARV